MRRFFAVCILALPALAQQDNQLALGGTVANGKTGEPIRRAEVTVTRFALPQGEARQGIATRLQMLNVSGVAFTDSGGMFHISGLPAGQYTITARKPEFLYDAESRTGPINLSTSIENVTVKLLPLGVITGKIVDQDGLPLRGVSIVILSAQIRDGLRQVRSDRTVTTDDRGIYRVWNLSRGKYYVKASGLAGATLLYVGDSAPSGGDESLAPVYFGGSRTFDSAAPIEIGPGSEAHADFSLRAEPAFRIRGSVANLVSRRTVKFELLSGAEDISASRVTLNSDTGRFEVISVVAGSYVLRATQDDKSAEVAVTVGSSDLDGIALTLVPSVDIPYMTQFTNAARNTQRGPDSDVEERQFCNPVLHPVGRQADRPVAFGQPNDTGDRNSINGVMPGRYNISVQCFGAYPSSAMSGTQDLAVNPILNVIPGVSAPPIEIVATHGGGSIKGKVSSEAAGVLPNATVLLVPQFSTTAGPQVTNAFRNPDDQNLLEFGFGNLAPGSYTAWAFASAEIEYRNPDFLRSLAGGAIVEIEGDAEKELTISGVIR
jgi:hypothetical protein